jgi:hypothetical protein
MDTHQKQFYDSIKKMIIQNIIVVIFTVIIALLAFYYNTKSDIAYQAEQIKEIKSKLDYLIQIHIK